MLENFLKEVDPRKDFDRSGKSEKGSIKQTAFYIRNLIKSQIRGATFGFAIGAAMGAILSQITHKQLSESLVVYSGVGSFSIMFLDVVQCNIRSVYRIFMSQN